MRQYLVFPWPACVLPIDREGLGGRRNRSHSATCSYLKVPKHRLPSTLVASALAVYYNKRRLTHRFLAGDQIYVYGIPSSGNGASAIFILDNTPPQSVNTSNVSKGGSDPIILWSNQTLEAGNHTLRVEYDPSSRKDDTIRYLVLHNFSYNDLSKYMLMLNNSPYMHVLNCTVRTFSLPAPPNSASSPALPSPTVQPSENENFIAGYTWNKYVAPAPILGAVLSTAVLLLLFGTTILLCKYRRKRRQDALAPDPFIDRGNNKGWSNSQWSLTSFADSFPDSMPSHIHLSTIQESTDTSQHYLRLRPYVEPIQAQRDFPPPPRPPPTVTSFSHGDQIAETLSTMSLDERQSSIYEPRGSRLHIPGSSYRRHVSSISFFVFDER